MMTRMVVFDLDGTLAESKQPIDPAMADLFGRLLTVKKVAVISGGDWPQFQKQLLGQLRPDFDYDNLYLLPTSGTKLYRFTDAWQEIYANNLSDAERNRIIAALGDAEVAAGWEIEPSWGDKIEDRGTQITFSALGQQAPPGAKAAWDPKFTKRKMMKALLDARLPDFSVRTGGSTSIDITRPGIDKSSGIRALERVAGINLNDMVFIGDALYPGGNDAPVKEMGVRSIAVESVADTRTAIEAILAESASADPSEKQI